MSAASRPQASVGAERPSVLFVQTQQYFGADSFVHSLLMRGLPALGFDVHVAVERGSGSRQGAHGIIGAIPGIQVVPMAFGAGLSERTLGQRLVRAPEAAAAGLSVVRLARYVRKHRIQVVHATEKPRDVLVASALGGLTSARSVIHLHVKCHEHLGRVTMAGLKRADAVVAVSNFVRESTLARGFAPARVHAIANAIDVDAWTPCPGDREAVRTEFGMAPDTPLLVIAARIFRWKGHELLVEALALVRRAHPTVQLLVVGADDPRGDAGGSSMTERLRRQVADLGLDENVVFTGHRTDMRRLLGACDIFTMPSFEEPFGLVFAEAMAMSKPVVALSSGGALEVVADGETGLLSPPGDAEALAGNISLLLGDPALRDRIGRAGRERVERLFRPERLCEDYAAFYRSLVPGHGTRA